MLAYELLDEDNPVVPSHLIASSSSDEDPTAEDVDGEHDAISKYRSLLFSETSQAGGERPKEDADGNMEMSWIPDQEEETEVKELTPWEKFLRKKKDRKKEKRKLMKASVDQAERENVPDDVDLNDPFFAEELGIQTASKKSAKKAKKQSEEYAGNKDPELDLLVMDSEDDKSHFDYRNVVENETKTSTKKKKKKLKGKKAEEKGDSFVVDVKDDRFSAIFSRADYNIDPSEQNFKKTKGMERLIEEKQKRLQSSENPQPEHKPKKSKLDSETSANLRSVKNKWKKNSFKKSK